MSLHTFLASLQDGPDRFRALVTTLPIEYLIATEGEGSWSPLQVIAHVTHLESFNWVPRLKTALRDCGECFPPLDRTAHETAMADVPLAEMLQRFENLRRENLTFVESLALDASMLERTAIHPELGMVTAGQLIATWSLHDWAHLTQIARTVSKQHKGAAGAWHRYFNVLKLTP